MGGLESTARSQRLDAERQFRVVRNDAGVPIEKRRALCTAGHWHKFQRGIDAMEVPPMDRILVGVDGSGASLDALGWAADIATRAKRT
jgi:hypothetical protein